MSARSTTHFVFGDETKPHAIVYRHSDGYPECAGVGILRFLAECELLEDPRFRDPTYLAAKYVVYLAGMFRRGDDPLEFRSVGVMISDPLDIEYRYVIDCKNVLDEDMVERPTVKCYKISGKFTSDGDVPASEWTLTEEPIPTEEVA